MYSSSVCVCIYIHNHIFTLCYMQIPVADVETQDEESEGDKEIPHVSSGGDTTQPQYLSKSQNNKDISNLEGTIHNAHSPVAKQRERSPISANRTSNLRMSTSNQYEKETQGGLNIQEITSNNSSGATDPSFNEPKVSPTKKSQEGQLPEKEAHEFSPSHSKVTVSEKDQIEFFGKDGEVSSNLGVSSVSEVAKNTIEQSISGKDLNNALKTTSLNPDAGKVNSRKRPRTSDPLEVPDITKDNARKTKKSKNADPATEVVKLSVAKYNGKESWKRSKNAMPPTEDENLQLEVCEKEPVKMTRQSKNSIKQPTETTELSEEKNEKELSKKTKKSKNTAPNNDDLLVETEYSESVGAPDSTASKRSKSNVISSTTEPSKIVKPCIAFTGIKVSIDVLYHCITLFEVNI
jgi:hypothetical protein